MSERINVNRTSTRRAAEILIARHGRGAYHVASNRSDAGMNTYQNTQGFYYGVMAEIERIEDARALARAKVKETRE